MRTTCTACEPGYYIKKLCTSQQDTVCQLCPVGTFQPALGFATKCTRCSGCKRKEFPKKKCTVVSDTKCGCPANQIYHKFRPCTACPTNKIVQNNKCVNSTLTPPTKTPPPNATLSIETWICIGIGSILLLALLTALGGLYCYRRHRKNRRKNPPDEVSEEAQEIKKPFKPPEHVVNENIYSPLPPFTKPTHVGCKRLDSDSLPFELFNELSYLLSSSRTKNYKHLADKLGYKYGQIKRFQESKDPVSALLDDYLTKPNPTKEELYNALLEINRYDVAARVEKEL